MRTMLLMAVVACGGKSDAPAGSGSAWTEVPYNAPILSKRMVANPYETNADPRLKFTLEVDRLFARDLDNPDPEELLKQVTAIYDGTDTLFLQFPGCNHEQLARHLQVIGAAKAKAAGFTKVACGGHPDETAKAAIAIP